MTKENKKPVPMWTDTDYAEGYMCLTTFEHELGMTHSTIYSSIEECKECAGCSKYCGIVKIHIEAEEIVLPRCVDEVIEKERHIECVKEKIEDSPFDIDDKNLILAALDRLKCDD